MTPPQIMAADQIHLPVLTIMLFLPLAGALLIWLLEDLRTVRRVAAGVSGAVLGLSLLLWFYFQRGTSAMQFVEQRDWIPPLGISYHIGIDGISLLLVILTALLTFLLIAYSWNAVRDQTRLYLMGLLALETTTLGTFMALDLVLFFLFWELMLIPFYFLIKLWGGVQKEYAALKYIVYMLTGSVLMLVGLIVLYLNYHQYAIARGGLPPYSFDYLDLLQAPISPAKQIWVFALLFFGFAFKGPVLPFHTWMPSVLAAGPVAVGVMLSGIKLGAYGFLRFSLPLAPEATRAFAPLMIALALAAILYAAMIALIQQDLRRLIAYSSISHLGFIILGLFALTPRALQGGALQIVNLGISTGGLFLMLGLLEQRTGTTRIESFGGLTRQVPLLAAFTMVLTLSSLGLPGTNLFVGEFLILLGASEASWIYAAVAVLGVIFGAAYLLWMYERVILGPPRPESAGSPLRDLDLREGAIGAALVVLVFWIGVYPAPVLRVITPSVAAGGALA